MCCYGFATFEMTVRRRNKNLTKFKLSKIPENGSINREKYSGTSNEIDLIVTI